MHNHINHINHINHSSDKQRYYKANELEINIFRKYAWAVTFLMTLILLIAGKIKKKSSKKGEIKGEA